MKPLKIIQYVLLSLLLVVMPLTDTAVLVFANDVSPIEYEIDLDFQDEPDVDDEDLIITDEAVKELDQVSQALIVQDDPLPDPPEEVALEALSSQRVIAQGRFENQPGANGILGAPWRLYENGTLEVDEGFIYTNHWWGNWRDHWDPRGFWGFSWGPWSAYTNQITQIVFTGPITAGASLSGLFGQLVYVTTIEGLEQFDTRHVTNMSAMFAGASALTYLDVSNWDTRHVTNMSAMFAGASALTYLDVSNWKTRHVTNMSAMFANAYLDTASALTYLDVSNWDIRRVTNMDWMFTNTSALTHLDLSSWDTRHVTTMRNMFIGMTNLRVLTLGQQFNFRGNPQLPAVPDNEAFTGHWQNVGTGTQNNPTGEFVFTSAELMANFNGTTMADTFVWQRHETKTDVCPTIASGQFANQAGDHGLAGATWRLCENGTLEVDEGFINWTTTISPLQAYHDLINEVRTGFINWDAMNWNSPWLAYRDLVTDIVFTGPITAGSSLNGLFSYLSYVTTIEGLEQFDTSQVTDMQWLFLNTNALTHLDLSSWDTSNVTNMFAMFADAQNLTYLDVSSWDTGNVTNMSAMFNNANSLPHLDLTNWDTGRVTNMSAMFTSASGLTHLDLSNWDTSRVTLMASTFTSASGLAKLNLSNWDTSQVTDMRWLFQNASSLTSLDLSNWDTSNAEMDWMFHNTSSLSQLTLGQRSFIPHSHLPAVPNNEAFTGYWQNVGSGTVVRPEGNHVFTSAQLMANFDGPTMADTFVWQPVTPPQPEQGRILALSINDFDGAIDQEAQTITFYIPEESLIFGHLLGTISALEADDESVILSTGEHEFMIRKGMLGIFVSGNTIFTPDGVVYTIQIKPYVAESRIFHLNVNQFQASINQEQQTITFHVPAQSLFFGNLLIGSITDLQADSESIIVSFNGINQKLRQGNPIILSSGETISTPDGIIYTIQIIPF